MVIDETAKNQLKKTKLLGAATLFRVTKGYVNLDKNSIYLPRQYLSQETVSSYPFLAARIELAAVFGLSRPEALLLDIHAADKGHCLLVDIRKSYRRSKRRLILIQTGHERQTLSKICRLFEKVDCGPKGPEGNYRQRQYRLKTLLPAVMEMEDKPETISDDGKIPSA